MFTCPLSIHRLSSHAVCAQANEVLRQQTSWHLCKLMLLAAFSYGTGLSLLAIGSQKPYYKCTGANGICTPDNDTSVLVRAGCCTFTCCGGWAASRNSSSEYNDGVLIPDDHCTVMAKGGDGSIIGMHKIPFVAFMPWGFDSKLCKCKAGATTNCGEVRVVGPYKLVNSLWLLVSGIVVLAVGMCGSAFYTIHVRCCKVKMGLERLFEHWKTSKGILVIYMPARNKHECSALLFRLVDTDDNLQRATTAMNSLLPVVEVVLPTSDSEFGSSMSVAQDMDMDMEMSDLSDIDD